MNLNTVVLIIETFRRLGLKSYVRKPCEKRTSFESSQKFDLLLVRPVHQVVKPKEIDVDYELAELIRPAWMFERPLTYCCLLFFGDFLQDWTEPSVGLKTVSYVPPKTVRKTVRF